MPVRSSIHPKVQSRWYICTVHRILFRGLERALEGKVTDDALEVSIDAVDAYGEYNKELTQVVSASMFEGVDTLEEGMEFPGRD